MRSLHYLLIPLIVFLIGLPAEAGNKIQENHNQPEILEQVHLNLNDEDNEVTQSAQVEENQDEKSLAKKLEADYELEVWKYDIDFLLKEKLIHKYDENSKMDRFHIWGAYNGDLGLSVSESGSVSNHYDTNALNLGFDGFTKDEKSDFRIMMSFPTRTKRNYAQTLFADVYVSFNQIPKHKIILGHTRAPVGVEGGGSSYTLPFINRSQISRNFGTARKIGARVKGDYEFIDYDFGLYSSDTYFQEFFPGGEFAGWVNFKPLGKKNKDKYGELTIGGGVESGHRENTYCVTGLYAGYEYKRFLANFEWANADGYNGTAGHSIDKHAGGFYTTLGYMLTKKLQLLVRYDELDPDKNIGNNKKREYTAGINYYIKGQALKVMLNYVFCQNDNSKDSHRIILGTQILI